MDLNTIAQLIQMVNNSSLAVLEVEDKEIRVRLENKSVTLSAQAGVPVMPMVSQQVSVAVPQTVEVKDDTAYNFVKSPIVGTFHSLNAIGKGTLNVGDKVEKGQVLCAVEAMKLMNDIESDTSGEVVEVMVKDGDMVEFGQALVKLK
ncbi:MAG: acetyl-CoA carboxylase biotin carboxyl carrier protein [Hyphomonadaceae bacterium]|nr:acetyl-CoA carboxylase biotin carboxyl carrier protein [Clostridia bacterium]